MSLRRRGGRSSGGFTLLELLVGMTVASVALAAVALASVALQRSYEAANYQMTAQNDQLRVFDYISRDLHMATAITVLNGDEKITATLPAADPTTLQLDLGPLLGNVRTGNSGAASTQTISYYVEGGQLLREADGVQTSLADTVAEAHFKQDGSAVMASLLFTPRFSASTTVAVQGLTRVTNYVYLRNAALAN